ncbi:DHA2 family multidrug resistance protein-like MFS transporter [Crossiella equi]|uniref:DHA2 family multidrug resistance protein-like MFS transporter n=1 Tax=Crossiella equi TaxID=130796 RepID=A0ABS5ARY5_9PSEU|nr:MFS transporter [Crossiella equi]MBP2479326.1 DHA2 family multidrug resistance protein-like MFS transporter [Crossiella equi]
MRWLALAVLTVPCVLVSMDLSVLFYAVPALTAELRPSSAELLWILDLYGFVLAGLLITMGTLGDRFGRRRVLLAGAALFGVASVLAAYAPDTEPLIAARALLGVAGATLAPSTLALIRTLFTDAGERQVAVSIWTIGFAGGSLVGPVIGGLLLEHFHWGSVFLLNVPVMALLLVFGPFLLPEARDPEAGRFDLVGAGLSLAAILPMIYGVKKLATEGFTVAHLLPIAAGLAVGWLFVRRQLTAEHPMLDLRLFRLARFSGSVVACAITFLMLAGLGMFVSQYLQLVLGHGPFVAALWTLPGMAGMLLGVGLATALAPTVRPATLVAVGLVVGGVGFALIAQAGLTDGELWVAASEVALAAGIGAVASIATNLVLATAPPNRAGAAAAISETANEFGGAAGIAILGSAAAVVYRTELTATPPAGLAPDQLATAADTLAMASRLAAELPEPTQTALLTAARESFVSGMHWVAWTGALGCLVLAVFVALTLRSVEPGDVDAAAAPVK